MQIDFTKTASAIEQDIWSLIHERTGALPLGASKGQKDFIASWCRLMVVVKDSKGLPLELDVAMALKFLDWDALRDLCEPNGPIGEKQEAIGMRMHFLTHELSRDEARIEHGYRVMLMACSLTSLRDIPVWNHQH
jgi:hypothetical protein